MFSWCDNDFLLRWISRAACCARCLPNDAVHLFAKASVSFCSENTWCAAAKKHIYSPETRPSDRCSKSTRARAFFPLSAWSVSRKILQNLMWENATIHRKTRSHLVGFTILVTGILSFKRSNETAVQKSAKCGPAEITVKSSKICLSFRVLPSSYMYMNYSKRGVPTSDYSLAFCCLFWKSGILI